MLWLYYASLKSNEILLITANTIGCVVETIYIAIYIVFAPKQARVLNRTLSLPVSLSMYLLLLLLFFGTYICYNLNHIFPVHAEVTYFSSNALTKNFGLLSKKLKKKKIGLGIIDFHIEASCSDELWGILLDSSSLTLLSSRRNPCSSSWLGLCSFFRVRLCSTFKHHGKDLTLLFLL